MLAREVLRLRGTIASREAEWDIMTDLYFYRDPEAEENKEAIEEQKVPTTEEAVPQTFEATTTDNWEVTGTQGTTTFVPPAPAAAPGGSWDTDADWGTTPAPATGGGDWAAEQAPDPASGW